MREHNLELNRDLAVGKPSAPRSRVDPVLFFAFNVVIIAGLAMLFSASYPYYASKFAATGSPALAPERAFLRQFAYTAVGYLAMLALMLYFDVEKLKRWAPLLFFASTILLVLVLLVQPHAPFKRWLSVGPLHFQPSELAKFTAVFMIASIAAKGPEILERAKGYLLTLGLVVLLPAALVAVETDLGTALVLVLSGLAMLALAGARWGLVALTLVVMLGLLVPVINLRERWSERVWSLFYYKDQAVAHGVGHQLLMSMIAVGSGGVTGKGFGKSIQKFGYLPEANSDFIFAVTAEELGSLGAGLLLAVMGFIWVYGLYKAMRLPSLFRALVAGGICLVLGFQTLLNVLIVLACAPTTGLPLPFFSHGGTARVVYLVAVGLLLAALREEEEG